MDTHVVDNTLVPPLSSRRPEMALPGENEAEATAPASPSPPTPPPATPRRSRRGALLAGVALTAVVLVATGVFLVSPYNTILPVGVRDAVATARQGAENTVRTAAQAVGLVAPAARIATAPPPMPVPAPVREAPPRTTREAQVEEILAYQQRQGAPGPSRPESAANQPAPEQAPTTQRRPVEPAPLARRIGEAPRTPEVQQPVEARPALPSVGAEVGAPRPATVPPSPAAAAVQHPEPAPVLPGPAATPASLAIPPVQPAAAAVPTTPAMVLPVPVPPSTVAPPPDAVAIAANLRPAPMSTPQQVEVLGLVTEMAVIQRNREARDRQMQADLAAMREQLENTVADLSRRLALAEARGAMNAAMGAAAPPPPVQASAPPAVIPVAARSPASAASAPADNVRRRYRVQAASPGLAMLSEVDRTGESGSQLQVAVGDEVPGYGKITAIAQQGSSWVVRAERGTIQ